MTEKINISETPIEHFTIEPVELVEVIDEFSKLLEKIERYNPHVDKELIKRALRFAAVAHAGQRRKSGKPFIYHGIQAAGILADLHLDSVMIACGILHDVVEDTSITIDMVKSEFGDEIANIIDGLTKIAGLKLMSPEEQQTENFRKMILYTARDIRTVLVKFADRLHNMRTLEYLPDAKRKRIAHETLEVFAPLAHRFGIYTIKTELEDLSLRWLYPREYKKIKRSIERITEERDNYLENFINPIQERLSKENIEHTTQWRLKNLYSIYRKMTRAQKTIREIYDIFAIRIIVNSIAECYHTLGIIHAMFTPVIPRIKDFIATPKFNMYQSIHTTVVGPKGGMVEVQIRTLEMHETAETGIAAHWRYKEGKVEPDEIDVYMAWLRKMVDWQSGTPEPKEFMHELKLDLFQDEIFVFTPKGDLIQLPLDSTPVDFAFALHTEIGIHCSGAKVNGRMVTLDRKLVSGEMVEITTNPNKHPSPGWLNTVMTAKARSLIRRWIKRQRYDESFALGLDMLSKIDKVRGEKLTEDDRQNLVEKYHQRNWDQFIASLGSGDISIHSVRNYFGLTDKPKRGKHKTDSKNNVGVSIQGMENLLVSFAECCKPLPGDNIIGFITRGRGMVIHRSDCENVAGKPESIERAIHVDWEPKDNMFFVASLRVEALNRKSLLSDVTSAIARYNCNIRSANIQTQDDIAFEDFNVDVKSLKDLQNLMKEIRKVKGVSRVVRFDMRSPGNIQKENE
ncbi:MAG: bifunctional (p)ppGpp synthetase/guanosine-3',5'-bis(diphosphate) 3'-pyrophosphohydrolase [Candidatus Latescibacteria bacterium]|nr:bifunctional (p)ppGpp synthetase/guanosine-3',5'-bis(diphosphate) 3'-pyrophosphohydrolase [Candidatus Latescibacterota bacterium]